MIRHCTATDIHTVTAIINEAARAYRGIIPADCWREPYMEPSHLVAEIAAGVEFRGWDEAGVLLGAGAHWAIRFYERHGFQLVPTHEKDRLLNSYWNISPRQQQTSVVLTRFR